MINHALKPNFSLVAHRACNWMEWAHLGSNQGPTGYEPVALPTELWAHAMVAFRCFPRDRLWGRWDGP